MGGTINQDAPPLRQNRFKRVLGYSWDNWAGMNIGGLEGAGIGGGFSKSQIFIEGGKLSQPPQFFRKFGNSILTYIPLHTHQSNHQPQKAHAHCCAYTPHYGVLLFPGVIGRWMG